MGDEETQNQEDGLRARGLRQARAQQEAQQPKESGVETEEVRKLERLAANKDKIVTFALTPIIAGGNALLNYFVIGAIPLLGDVIDFGAGASMSALLFTLEGHPRWKAQGFVWLLTAVELVPGADIVSPQALGVTLALVIAWRAGSKAEKKLATIRSSETQESYESY